MTDLTGKTLGQYTITREIGRGGMAIVYEAYQPSLNRHVAIKVLPAQFTFDGVLVERFLQEARAAARLEHPNIVPIYDVGNQDGQYYIVMQKLPGEALNSLITREGRLSLARAAKIVSQLAAALDYAHQRGFIHRDVKPANIIVGPDDHVWLTDFGIARAMEGTRLTRSGMVMGTPEYMSPEQAQGEEPGPRGDLYALGIVLYEMLAGRAPFQGSTPLSVLHKQVYDAPPSVRSHVPNLPASVEAILGRALEKDPARRFATAGELARAVQETIQSVAARPTVLAPAVSMSPRPRTPAPPPLVTSSAASPAQETARGWRYPVLPVTAGVAVVVLLIVLAVLVPKLPGLLTGKPTSLPIARITPTAPAIVAPTVTLVAGTPEPAPTVQPAGTTEVAIMPANTPSSATSTPGGAPTSTLAPTATLVLPTLRPAVVGKVTETATTAAPGRKPLPPQLVSPHEGDTRGGKVTFEWQPSEPLPADALYEVVMWNEGDDANTAYFGVADATTGTSLIADLDYQKSQGRIKNTSLYWTVLVVRTHPYRHLTMPSESVSRKLIYQPPSQKK